MISAWRRRPIVCPFSALHLESGRRICTFVVKRFTAQIPHLIKLLHSEMTAWRQDLHAHSELGFEEHRTSEFVAGKLAEFGCEVHRNIGKTTACTLEGHDGRTTKMQRACRLTRSPCQRAQGMRAVRSNQAPWRF